MPAADDCAICARTLRPTEQDGYACTACIHRIRSWYTEIPRQLPLLQASLQPDVIPRRGQVGGTGRAHAPVPLRLDVLDLLGPGQILPLDDPHGDQSAGIPLTPLLRGWARYTAAEYPAVWQDKHGTQHIGPCEDAVPRRGTDTTAWCTWLIRYLPYAATRPWIRELHDQLQDTIARVRRITATRPGRRPLAAPCPACKCCALVETDGEWDITCEVCGHRLDRDAYDELADSIADGTTAAAIMAAFIMTTTEASTAA